MKRLLIFGTIVLALAGAALGQPSNSFVNNGVITEGFQVDALNFTNNGSISLSLGVLFDFSDVLNYTNRGTMSADLGFIFDTVPAGNAGARHMATSFGNGNTGTISAGAGSGSSFGNPAQVATPPTLSPQIRISATNVVNSGTLDVGANGLISVTGKIVNLTRGSTHVEGFGDAVQQSLPLGIFDSFWGVGTQTNQIKVANFTMPFPFSPPTRATTIFNVTGNQSVSAPGALAFANVHHLSPSNVTYQIVFVSDSGTNNPAIDVRFEGDNGEFATPVIQWLFTQTNSFGQSVTNTLYLTDAFGVDTNLALTTNGFSLSGVPQPAPTNYNFSLSFPAYDFLPRGNTNFSASFFNNAFSTNAPFSALNDYSIWQVNLQPVTFRPEPGSTNLFYTNVPGRIQITADQALDLTRAHITSPNYLLLSAPNHFVGSSNADIAFPFGDINLGTTNGQLVITNLVTPFLTRITGTVDAWSARWTNVSTTNIVIGGTATDVTITNRFHVMIVNSRLAPNASPIIENLALRGPNVVISDVMNVTNSLLVQAQSLTITSNSPGSQTPLGQLNLISPNLIWSPSLPTLQFLTNWGSISTLNTTYFQVRQSPDFPSPSDGPYQAFVNHGSIRTSGNIIWANYFENSGSGTNSASISSASFGPISVQATSAMLANGTFLTSAGDITLTCGSLSVSNHSIQTSGSLSLNVTGQITDGGGASNNFWQVGDGFNLPIKPALGDLLGTTVSNICPAGLEVENLWAGLDLGASSAGFANNGAIGHLILDGGDANSSFHFAAAGAQNALYVDLLELRNGATNRAAQNGVQFFSALNIDPNMTIYFADAIIGNLDISEKLDGANGGRLHWVPSFVGTFSSTNITYPTGITYSFNRALVSSTTIDSNGNGLANAYDQYPILTPDTLKVTITTTNKPARTAMISWQTPAHSTNYVYYKTNYTGGPWLVLTNFVQGSLSAKVTVTDTMRTNGAPAYYKVRVDPAQP